MTDRSNNFFEPVIGSLRAPARLSDSLDGERDSLTDADAHGAKRDPRAGANKFFGRGLDQPCSGHAERMPQRDCTAIGVDWGGIVGKPKLTPVSYTHLDVYKRQAFWARPCRTLREPAIRRSHCSTIIIPRKRTCFLP